MFEAPVRLENASPEAVRLLEHCGVCPQQLFTQLCEGELARKERSMQNTRLLDQFGVDMLERAGKQEPVIGRRQEIETVLQILSRRHKNNPALIGEPGVGKTAIAEGLAQRIVRGDVPEGLKDKTISRSIWARWSRAQSTGRIRGAAQGRARGSAQERGAHPAVHR